MKDWGYALIITGVKKFLPNSFNNVQEKTLLLKRKLGTYVIYGQNLRSNPY